jgi:hypothetical protein
MINRPLAALYCRRVLRETTWSQCPISYEDLVLDRSDTFQVHTDVYMDREVFEVELRNIFERTWV